MRLKHVARWWFEIYFFVPPPREMIQFDEYIFQMGWFNHQPANFDLNFCCVQIGEIWNLETRSFFFSVPGLLFAKFRRVYKTM